MVLFGLNLPSLCCSYCVQMRVKQASAACKVRPWSAGLVRERAVCVECQSDAMTTDNRCLGDGLQKVRYVLHTHAYADTLNKN